MGMSVAMGARQWGALGASLLTSLVVFARRVLVLNAWAWPPPPTHVGALALSLLSGTLFWASLNSVRGTVELQFASGMASTLLSWAVLVLLVNRDLRLPTRQQLASAGFYAITEASILLQARLLLA